MNVIAQLEYELAYYDSAVHHFNHYTTRTSPNIRSDGIKLVLEVKRKESIQKQNWILSHRQCRAELSSLLTYVAFQNDHSPTAKHHTGIYVLSNRCLLITQKICIIREPFFKRKICSRGHVLVGHMDTICILTGLSRVVVFGVSSYSLDLRCPSRSANTYYARLSSWLGACGALDIRNA